MKIKEGMVKGGEDEGGKDGGKGERGAPSEVFEGGDYGWLQYCLSRRPLGNSAELNLYRGIKMDKNGRQYYKIYDNGSWRFGFGEMANSATQLT